MYEKEVYLSTIISFNNYNYVVGKIYSYSNYFKYVHNLLFMWKDAFIILINDQFYFKDDST